MKKEAFWFDLPEQLIAKFPADQRTHSRLLNYCSKQNKVTHHIFNELPELLSPGDLLIMNNSRVLHARLFGQKSTGGQVELLVERIEADDIFLAHIRASKAPKAGTYITLNQQWGIEVQAKEGDIYLCKTIGGDTLSMLEAVGELPLPSYLDRAVTAEDEDRYQTVYANPLGSVAAPTAGLHFDHQLLQRLQQQGIQTEYLTLHVGAGTFRPVRTESILEHKMHSERFYVSKTVCEKIIETKAKGHRVIAVGTTVLRSLESAAKTGELIPQSGETDIFIYPGYVFQVCDGLVTNFHLPESTLLMLVSAFIGHQQAMDLYALAIEHRYRFYSYGDASLLWRR